MFFKFKRRFNLLRIEGTFAHLKNITKDGDLEFEFCYNIKQMDAIQRDALTVKTSVITEVVRRKPILDNSHRGWWNTRGIVGNILRNVSRAKLNVKEREKFIISSRNSDLGAKVNTSLLPRLAAGVSPRDIQELKRSSLVLRSLQSLKEKNQVMPLFDRVAHESFSDVQTETSSSIELDRKLVMRDMIIRQGIDPTSIFKLTDRSISSYRAFGGISRTNGMQERSYDPAVRLLHSHVFNHNALPLRTLTSAIFNEQEMVQVAETVISDEIEVPITITIPHKGRKEAGVEDIVHYIVKFELIDNKNNAVIDTISKSLDVGRHIQLYHTPRIPPSVFAASNEFTSKVNLTIQQRDLGAESVEIWKKIIPRSSVLIDDYRLIGTFDLTPEQRFLSVQVDKPIDSPVLYRVISVGDQGSKGFDFTNVVVRPPRYKSNKAIAINVKSVDVGVEVEVRSIPAEAISVIIMARDLTIFQKDLVAASDDILIDEATREADTFSIIDRTVQTDHIYEYVARIVYRDGTTQDSVNAIHEYIEVEEGKVNITIEDLEVDNSDANPNVTFRMNSALLDTDVDIIRDLLEKQGIDEFFNDELLNERDLFKDLVAHNVQRVNMTTGTREDFGTLTNEVFNDEALRKNNSVSPLEYGSKYRYEISTLLRSAESLFEQFVKQKVDSVTSKSYRFKPSKFLHPVTLKRGTVVTPSGLKSRFPKDPMSHGRIGTTEIIEVSFDGEPAVIVDLTAAQFDKTLNILSWKVEGSISQVDHFVIMKEVHGVRTLIGKAHSEFPFGNAQFIHELGNDDTGAFNYVVMPIFNDYDTGAETVSNVVMVERSRSPV